MHTDQNAVAEEIQSTQTTLICVLLQQTCPLTSLVIFLVHKFSQLFNMASLESKSRQIDNFSNLSQWSGFFKKSLIERQSMVANESNLCGQLPLNIADLMIENCIGTLSLPSQTST